MKKYRLDFNFSRHSIFSARALFPYHYFLGIPDRARGGQPPALHLLLLLPSSRINHP